jgi:hypothetical protein
MLRYCFLFSFLLHAQKKRNKEKGATKTAIPTRATAPTHIPGTAALFVDVSHT